jgi:hypothetical protein
LLLRAEALEEEVAVPVAEPVPGELVATITVGTKVVLELATTSGYTTVDVVVAAAVTVSVQLLAPDEEALP